MVAVLPLTSGPRPPSRSKDLLRAAAASAPYALQATIATLALARSSREIARPGFSVAAASALAPVHFSSGAPAASVRLCLRKRRRGQLVMFIKSIVLVIQ